MPYASISELPASIRSALPAKAQEQWLAVYNATAGDGELAAIRQAWAAVGENWEKADGKWVAKAEPQTLYVHRPLKNGAEFIAWAKAQGFGPTLTAEDLHVTIASSRAAVDWGALELHTNTLVASGGARTVKPLGDKGAVVLRFDSDALQSRWQEFRDAGASWDYEGYQPHVTITYSGSDVDLSKVEPFTGALEFGAEVFAPVNDDWVSGVVEKSAIEAEVLKVDDSLGLVFGWAIVSEVNGKPYVDTQNDYIPSDVAMRAIAKFMEGERVAKTMHVGERTGTVTMAFPMEPSVMKALGISSEKTGVVIAMKPDTEAQLALFKSGDMQGFSIGGSAKKEAFNAD